MLTVITPATTSDLTVLATVKEEFGITTSTDDAKLNRFINEASIMIATYCDRVFARETVAETFRYTTSMDTIMLDRYPVASITSIVEDGTTLTVDDDYAVDAARGYLSRFDGEDNLYTWASTGKTVVTYVGGYELLADLPRDIERACISLVKSMYFSSTRDPLVRSVDVPGVMSETFWVGGIGDNGALPPNVTALLNPYRRMSA